MEPKFRLYEIVRVIAENPRIRDLFLREALINKEGFVVGMSEPYEDNHRDFGVHINEYGETFALREDALERTGRMGSADDIVSRSRADRRGTNRRR